MAGLGDQVDIVAKGAEIWDNSKVYSLNHWSDHASINKNGGGGAGERGSRRSVMQRFHQVRNYRVFFF